MPNAETWKHRRWYQVPRRCNHPLLTDLLNELMQMRNRLKNKDDIKIVTSDKKNDKNEMLIQIEGDKIKTSNEKLIEEGKGQITGREEEITKEGEKKSWWIGQCQMTRKKIRVDR